MMLESLFDGWVHWVIAGEDFVFPAILSAGEIAEDEDEVVGDWELPTPIVDWRETGAVYPAGPLPGQEEESAWAGMSLALGSLVEIVGGKKKSYQENVWSPDRKSLVERKYAFQFIPGETGYYEGRL